jgi:hypothetical protein
MGQVKKLLDEAMERGFSVDMDIVVCPDCFEDDGLQEFIRNCGGKTPCSYCGKVGEGTCTLEELLDYAMSCIRMEWGHPEDEGVPYETREGGWQGNVIDSWELFETVGLTALNDDLQKEIDSALEDQLWCEREPFLQRKDQTLLSGWKAFTKFVMHEARYVFLKATPKNYDESQIDEMHPVEILDALSSMVEDIGLIETIPPTTRLYRVHIVDPKESLNTAKRLGSPPPDYAKYANRMSPAGISMFYGAFDLKTSVLETYDPSKGFGKIAAYGEFFPIRPLRVLDLSKKLYLPSLFDSSKHDVRPLIRFLIDFLKDFSKTVQKDEYAHVEYVPTQIVTEYFRHMYRTANGEQLDGIIYSSSKADARSAVVLFADNKACVEECDVSNHNAVLVLKGYGTTDPENPGL